MADTIEGLDTKILAEENVAGETEPRPDTLLIEGKQILAASQLLGAKQIDELTVEGLKTLGEGPTQDFQAKLDIIGKQMVSAYSDLKTDLNRVKPVTSIV